MTKHRAFISLAAVMAGALTLTFSRAADWPQYRGPDHNGISAERMPSWPSNGPSAVWRVPTPNGFSSFTVADGKAYTEVLRDVDGVGREVVLCLDAGTGKELWARPIAVAKYEGGGDSGTKNNSGGDGPRSTPSFSEGRVYAMSENLLLTAFEASTGKVLWEVDLIKEHGGRNISWKNAASPLVDGRLVFVAGGGEGQALLGINKTDGKVVWKGENDKMTHASPVAATILGVRQVIFFTQTGLVSVAPETGKVLWRHPFKYAVSTAASPVVCDDIVYCSAGYGVGATAVQLSKRDGKFEVKELWRETGNKVANHWSTPVYKDGYLYGMFQFKEFGDGPVKCMDVKTGKFQWEKPGFGPGNVILVGGELVILGDAGQLVLADPAPDAYREKSRFQAITGKCWSTPAFSNGRLYVRGTKEGACFDFSGKLSQR
jgi:outer membrane protein assembly factor BamB